jgi:hypothetical protein
MLILEQFGNNMINELREWVMLIFEGYICWILTMEYYFDKEIEEKKHKRTRTTKKTTNLPSGEIVTDETTETEEGKEK